MCAVMEMYENRAREEGRQEGRQEGRLEGRIEGRQEGRLEGRQEGLLEGRTEERAEAIRKFYRVLLQHESEDEALEELANLYGFSPADIVRMLGSVYENPSES